MTPAPKTFVTARSPLHERSRTAITPLLAAAILGLAAPAHASTTSPLQRWAQRHHLHGAWHAKDPDRDGITNRREYTLHTHPRRADSDRDGLRDGNEHAGIILAFDGTVITLRELSDRHQIDFTVDTSACADGDQDEGYVDVTETDDDSTPAADEDVTGCAAPRMKPGALISSLELTDRDGEPVATTINFAPTR